ncbi:MAG TPA: VOC family protein [Candidatus Binatia bacterium]|nr:VOC family protein [Candidatus Binatia bacterium]
MEASPIECLGVDHVDLTVNDCDASVALYARVLGWLGFRRVEEASVVVFENGTARATTPPSSPIPTG